MSNSLRADLQELVDKYKLIQAHLNNKLNISGPIYSKGDVVTQYDEISHMIGRFEDRLKTKDEGMLDIKILGLIQKFERCCEEEVSTSSARERSNVWEMTILDLTNIRNEYYKDSRQQTRQIVVRKV